jgi:hypothetical protein
MIFRIYRLLNNQTGLTGFFRINMFLIFNNL